MNKIKSPFTWIVLIPFLCGFILIFITFANTEVQERQVTLPLAEKISEDAQIVGHSQVAEPLFEAKFFDIDGGIITARIKITQISKVIQSGVYDFTMRLENRTDLFTPWGERKNWVYYEPVNEE